MRNEKVVPSGLDLVCWITAGQGLGGNRQQTPAPLILVVRVIERFILMLLSRN